MGARQWQRKIRYSRVVETGPAVGNKPVPTNQKLVSRTERFNWRAVMAPPAVLDYLVAHELAHLRVRGHTPEYWAVVAQAAPDHRLRRERLREVGPLLRI